MMPLISCDGFVRSLTKAGNSQLITWSGDSDLCSADLSDTTACFSALKCSVVTVAL